ncbi:hypothetical protein [Pengzhenrongella sp.]|jgi:hypothetical protein|uniref:hypothetical protein n=1 Tax=Pengzhenrongella sp. TaxID=2888820 RepID=UPI002F930565
MDPQLSAEWVIGRIEQHLRPFGAMIPSEIYRVYRTNVDDLDPAEKALVIEANNLGVEAIRKIIGVEKAMGAPTVRIRWGLRLPVEWEAHYETIYQTDFPWFISGVLQNAFLGNPMAGEHGKWRSP